MRIICTASCTRSHDLPGDLDGLAACVVGLERLGHDVYLMEHVRPEQCLEADFQQVPFSQWSGRGHFDSVARACGVHARSCLVYDDGSETHGLGLVEAQALARTADLLLVLGGHFRVPEIVESVGCRAYWDGNPAKTQVYYADYGVEFGCGEHDFVFTMGLNIGTPLCPLPTGGLTWRGALEPVVLEMWPASIDERCERFTTISSWAGRGTFDWGGRYSGEKSDNWLKFVELPRLTSQPLEVALAIDRERYPEDAARFDERNWILSDPGTIVTTDDLRAFYAGSRAEFSVAHNRYVEFNTGWFSERSARYLALGKPVLVQSTGIEGHLPTGEGLLTFTTVEEALAGIATINGDYLTHCRAARAIAEEFFDSDKVLSGMLREMGF